MLPTTYRGDATVAGEDLDAELFLDDVHLRLLSGSGGRSEILKWPLPSVRIEPVERGRYLFEAGNESFEFSPLVDDGLSDEIALRTRFAGVPDPSGPQSPSDETTSESSETIADKVRSVGSLRTKPRRRGVLSGGDLAVRTALVILGVLALVVVTAAVMSGSLDSDPATVIVSPSESTLPFTDEEAPATTSTQEADGPVATTVPAASPATTAPATTPPTTAPTTTAAPSTTTTTVGGDAVDPNPLATAGLELAPRAFVDRWNQVSNGLGGELPATNVEIGDGSFGFAVGERTAIEGTVASDGTVESFALLGDPDGTTEEDRLVITAMGMAVAVAAPDLDPSGRRALLEELGFDFENPDVEELDGVGTYGGYEYRLQWDPDARRIVFQVLGMEPAGEE